MSAHVEQQLWSHARGQLAPAEAEKVNAHLSACGDCKRVFEQFQAAVAVVKPIDPPVLDDAAWGRIDSRVMAAARHELARGASPFAWFFDNWRAFAAAGALAAAAVIFILFAPSSKKDVPVAPPEQLAKVETPEPIRLEPPRLEQPQEELVAATSGAEKFVALADGSVAGAVGESRFVTKKASASEVRLELERGTLVVAAAHAPAGTRTFAVGAGEVEIVVVGTRFLVERDEAVTVVVEEGKVEVAANGEKHLVSAGETLIIDTAGKPSRKKAVTPAARAAFKVLKLHAPVAEKTPEKTEAAVAQSQASAAQRLSDEDDSEAPAEGGAIATATNPDAGSRFGEPTPPPLLLPGDQQQGVASGAPKKEQKNFDLLGALKRINLKNINLDSPYPPVGMPVSEYRVHQLQRNADRGQCDRVVDRADAWMSEFSAAGDVKNRAVLTKAVLFTKARCLTKLGRNADAEKARAAAEAVR